jgi:hypothetical protein
MSSAWQDGPRQPDGERRPLRGAGEESRPAFEADASRDELKVASDRYGEDRFTSRVRR